MKQYRAKKISKCMPFLLCACLLLPLGALADGSEMPEDDWAVIEMPLDEEVAAATPAPNLAQQQLDQAYAENDALYGSHVYWPLEEQMRVSQLTVELGLGDSLSFGLPEPSHIQQDTAISLAKQAVTEKYGLGPDYLEAFVPCPSFPLFHVDASPAWEINFQPQEAAAQHVVGGEYYAATINAVTGEVVYVFSAAEGQG